MPNDKYQDFTEAYDQDYQFWGPQITEAESDLDAYENRSLTAAQRNYLINQDRQALEFNRIKRIVNLISGYERRNRLSLKIGAATFDDDETCSQMSGIIQHIMRFADGYNILSDAFEMGSLVTGANLVEPFIDRNGDIQLSRIFYNEFLLDSQFTRRDLKDCGHILKGTLLTTEQVKFLLPSMEKEIDEIPARGTNNRWTQIRRRRRMRGEELRLYEEFWQRTQKPQKFVVNRRTGQVWKKEDFVEEAGSASRADRILRDFKLLFAEFSERIETMELTIFLDEQQIYSGANPTKLDDYNHVLVAGYFHPESSSQSGKLQGIVRTIKDAQIADNLRINQILDLLESQVMTGVDIEEDAAVDPNAVYLTGQGQITWLKAGGLQKMARRSPRDIPPGIFQAQQLIDKLIVELPGINEELLGTDDKEIPGILARHRSGAALTTLQSLFDNYAWSKKLLGNKLVRIVQGNYSTRKVERILGQKVAQGFYDRDMARFDCIPTEGLLTDSQRQMHYMELRALREGGIPIPDMAIIDAAPLQMPRRLKQQIAQASEAQAKQQQFLLQQQQILLGLQQAKINADNARAEERRTQAVENQTGAALDRIKTAQEIESLSLGPHLEALKLAIEVEKLGQQNATAKAESR